MKGGNFAEHIFVKRPIYLFIYFYIKIFLIAKMAFDRCWRLQYWTLPQPLDEFAWMPRSPSRRTLEHSFKCFIHIASSTDRSSRKARESIAHFAKLAGYGVSTTSLSYQRCGKKESQPSSHLAMEDQIRQAFLNLNFTLEDDEAAEKCKHISSPLWSSNATSLMKDWGALRDNMWGIRLLTL